MSGMMRSCRMTVGLNSLAVSMASAGSEQKRNSIPGSSVNILRTVSDHLLIVHQKYFDGERVGHRQRYSKAAYLFHTDKMVNGRGCIGCVEQIGKTVTIMMPERSAAFDQPPTPFPEAEGGARDLPLFEGERGERGGVKKAASGEGSEQVASLLAWQSARDTYLARVRPWAEDRTRRMARHEKHPVYDFLFEYYSFRPAHLLRWTPGFGVILEGR